MYGSFSGNPKTEWLVDGAGPDRDMRVIEDFWYMDTSGNKWNAPADSIINGASIPRPLWSTVGSPYTDDYRCASIVHDVACNDPAVAREDADKMFYYACLAGGCSDGQAKLLYAGVRIGAWTKEVFPSDVFSGANLLFRIKEKPGIEAMKVTLKFAEIARELESLGKEATFEQIDAIVSKHLK